MFAQQQTQQLVGSARARVVSSRYVFHIEEHANEEREISFSFFEFFLFPILNAAGPST
jgi:nitrate reductase NapE component